MISTRPRSPWPRLWTARAPGLSAVHPAGMSIDHDRLLTLSLRMSASAARSGGVVGARQARALGAQDGDLRALIRAGLWVRLRRGVYGDTAHRSACPDAEHHREAAAVLMACESNAVVSSVSGAQLLGLPIARRQRVALVHLTRRPPVHGNPPAGAVVQVRPYDAEHVVLVDGLPVLAGPDLVLDCATRLPGPDALAVADAALRSGLVDRAALGDALVARASDPGSRRMRKVVNLADPLAETWLESVSRWWVIDAGLPRPVLQHEFSDDSRTARTDLYFPEHRTVGEADGAGKYDVGRQALLAEKQREEWLRDVFGVEVVRWMAGDLATTARRRAVMGRFRAAFERSARRSA
jgi:hypothetical protein